MAESLFRGRGFVRNYTLGLAYLQQELNKKSPAAALLLGNLVPLDVLLYQQLESHLHDAVELESNLAMAKLGVFKLLREDTTGEATRLLKKSAICPEIGDLQPDEPGTLARFLKKLPPELVNPAALAIWGARTALEEQSIGRACYFAAVAIALSPRTSELAEIVFSILRLARDSRREFRLPADLVEYSLEVCSARGEAEAQYALGCALAGAPYGELAPEQLVRNPHQEKAATLLLRSADAGKYEAWLNLSELIPGCRGAISSKGTARFFLEKAAHAGVLEAQTKLGAALLKEAVSLEGAQEGVMWLGIAADRSCPTARELLQTMVLPLPDLPEDDERSAIRRIGAIDEDLEIRVSLARSLHLTRREAMSFNATRDIKPWGLVIPGASYENPKGRLAPAVSQEMKTMLQRVSQFFAATPSAGTPLLVQRSRVQRQVFKQLSIPENLMFANEIGRSLSHYGYGRHWACRSAPILDSLFERRTNSQHVDISRI